MIDFATNDDTQQAVDLAQRFARDLLVPHRRDFETARGVSADVLAQARDIGFTLLDWPEADGGAALGAVAKMQMLEELAAGDAGAAAVIDGFAPVADALRAFGGSALVERHLGPVMPSGGRAMLVFDDRGDLIDDGNRLRGVLPWLPADRLDLLLVLDRERLTIVTDGLTSTRLNGAALQAGGASEWRVDAPVEERFAHASASAIALARARLHTAALMLGTMRATWLQARDYAVDRVAFGKPIAHHQALAFLIVDMRMAIDAARGLVHEAAWRADHGQPFVQEAAAAFVETGEAGMFVGPNAVQIYGAAGFMRDGPVEKPMRELRALALLYGGIDAAKDDAMSDIALPFLIAAKA